MSSAHTKKQIIRLLKSKGCEGLDQLTGDVREGIEKLLHYAENYAKATRETHKQPSELKELHNDLFFMTNVEYIAQAQRNFSACPEDIDKHQFQEALIPQIISTLIDTPQQLLIQCYIREILSETSLQPVTKGLQSVIKSLKQLVGPIKNISAGKYGTTSLCYMDKSVPLSIIKTSKTSGAFKGGILHEIAIGYALNTIRDVTGSLFAFTYGGFFCNSEDLECSDDWKQLQKVQTYSFQQYVAHPAGKPNLEKYLIHTQMTTVTQVQQLVNHIFYQVAYGLYQAQKHIGFYHLDLHGENVLVRAAAIRLMTLDFEEGVKVDLDSISLVPTIIDYGHSVCKIPATNQVLYNRWMAEDKQENIIAIGNSKQSLYPHVPLLDLYRYITFILVVLVNCDSKNRSVVNQAIYGLKNKWLTFLKQRADQVVVDKHLKHWLNLPTSNERQLAEWKQYYLDKALAYPHIEEGHTGFFHGGSLREWIQSSQVTW
jgi:hypothetical protein